MAQYTVKTFAPQGRLVGRLEFVAPNAYEAELAVHSLHDLRGQELWSAGRCIRSWPPRLGAPRKGGTAQGRERAEAASAPPPPPS
jgi:hypothetical protein